MNAAKDNRLAIPFRRQLTQLQTIATQVGVFDDFVLLVVMAKNLHRIAKVLFDGANPLAELFIRQAAEIFEVKFWCVELSETHSVSLKVK